MKEGLPCRRRAGEETEEKARSKEEDVDRAGREGGEEGSVRSKKERERGTEAEQKWEFAFL